jgi:hypothetical protein
MCESSCHFWAGLKHPPRKRWAKDLREAFKEVSVRRTIIRARNRVFGFYKFVYAKVCRQEIYEASNKYIKRKAINFLIWVLTGYGHSELVLQLKNADLLRQEAIYLASSLTRKTNSLKARPDQYVAREPEDLSLREGFSRPKVSIFVQFQAFSVQIASKIAM